MSVESPIQEELIDDPKDSSVEDGSSSKMETEENVSTKSKKQSKKAAKKKAEQATGNYNRYFLSNFRIENLFASNKKHAYRLSQDEVGLILSDASAFEKLQSQLRQEGCVTDGTIRVNYNDLLRIRLREIEEYQEENKEESNFPGTLQESFKESFAIATDHERGHVPVHSSHTAIDLTSCSSEKDGIPDTECVTPFKVNRPQTSDESESSDPFPSEADPAKKSSANGSPTSVLDMMDLEMKHIEQIFDNSESDVDEEMYGKTDNSDDEFVETSSVDSGLFVENRTFDRPAASAPVSARPWGRDTVSTKEDKIWDICAVEAPATTMDFDYLWEDDSNTDADIAPYRSKAYDYSSDEDIYNNEDVSSSQKRVSFSDHDSSSHDIRWQAPFVATDKFEKESHSRSPDKSKPLERFAAKKEFAYPTPGCGIPKNITENAFGAKDGGPVQIKTALLPKKRISRRQKRHHVVETLEI